MLAWNNTRNGHPPVFIRKIVAGAEPVPVRPAAMAMTMAMAFMALGCSPTTDEQGGAEGRAGMAAVALSHAALKAAEDPAPTDQFVAETPEQAALYRKAARLAQKAALATDQEVVAEMRATDAPDRGRESGRGTGNDKSGRDERIDKLEKSNRARQDRIEAIDTQAAP